MPSPVNNQEHTAGLKVPNPVHPSNDTPDRDKRKIHNDFYSMSNVLSINPDGDRFKKVILQNINGYKATTTNIIDYGKQCIDILYKRIEITAAKNEF